MSGRSNVLSALVILLGMGLALAGPARAQIPDEFTNLKILPKDIAKQDLVRIMRGFTAALGVRCSGCHVPGDNPNSLDGFDFASDEPEQKAVARAMLQMVNEINTKLLPATGREDVAEVRCITCHHGLQKPATINDVLLKKIDKDGVEAARVEYRQLRDTYYGTAAYDFTAGPLGEVAETLAESRQDVDGAIQIAMLALEFEPDNAMNHLMLGQLYSHKGDKEAAIKSLEKALELDPENRWAQRTLEQVKGGN